MRTNQAELNSIIERFSSSFREYIDLESPIENIEDCVRNIGGTISNLDAKYSNSSWKFITTYGIPNRC